MTFSGTDFGYFVVLEPGEELIRSLIQFAREQEIDAAALTGLGVVAELELGTSGGRGREHRRRLLHETLEICSLTGTLTLVDGEPFPHLHGSFALADHSVVGGHVYGAVCATGIELVIQVSAERLVMPGRNDLNDRGGRGARGGRNARRDNSFRTGT